MPRLQHSDFPRRFRLDSFDLLLAAVAGLGTALILAREATYGVGLSADYVTYLSTAESLLAGEGFVQIHDWPYRHWPPLYPVLLAIASLGVFNPLQVAGPLNAAVFGLSLWVVGQYLQQHLRHRFLVLWACLVIMLAFPLTRVASHAISEPPFILLVTLSLVQISRFLETRKLSDLIWAGILTSLAILTRYIGVTVVMAVLPPLFCQSGIGARMRVKHIGLYLSIVAIPLGLWLLRNLLAYGTLGGVRFPSPWTLREILDKSFGDMAQWVFLALPPDGKIRSAAVILTGMVLLALALAVSYTFVRAHMKNEGKGGEGFWLFGGFALVYLVVLVAAQTATELAPLGGRYLAPMYIPLLTAAVFALDKFFAWSNRFKGIAIGLSATGNGMGKTETGNLLTLPLAAALVLSLWLAQNVSFNVHEIRRNNEGLGMGLADPAWVHSEVLQYIRQNLSSAHILSNHTRALYIYTDHADYDYLESRLTGGCLDGMLHAPSPCYRYEQIRFGVEQQVENVPANSYIAWFHLPNSWNNYNYNIPELRAQLSRQGLDLVAESELDDGVIFKIGEASDHRSPYASVAGGEPVIRSRFHVYLTEGVLTYVRGTCTLADREARFFAQIVPVVRRDLPRQRRKYGFDYLEFDLDQHDVRVGDTCMVTLPLPEYAIAHLKTGQYLPGGDLIWFGGFDVPETVP